MSRTAKKTKDLRPGQPAKPIGLTDRASAEWDRLVAEIKDAGIQLTRAHRSALSLAATIEADMQEARKAIDKDGAYIEGKAGLVAHPAVKRLDALRRDKIKVLTMLGVRAVAGADPVTQDPTLADLVG